MLEVRVPQLVPESPNTPNFHWAQKARKVTKVRSDVAVILSQHMPPPLPLVVTLIRESTGTLDGHDNLAGSMKPVVDQVAIWIGLPRNKKGHANDADPRVTWRYEQRRVKRAERGTRIRFEKRYTAE